MACKIEYKSSVSKDLKKLDKKITKRILNELEKNLRENPDIGVPLSGQFKGLFKYRVGDYRIIYTKTIKEVLILRIGHRSKIYK
ncbi:MAG: ParE toxin of type II toxin-antitoxin system, parDE [Candidatus Argoarchaeum ethanivorans]|uniref:ParE toxin of type II toxin-antitoxin system, parDE n=1 Tax=Candidatus Argoarchaeum ethanivorans TaxID=2608793 RepID=A0A811T574_9EURY|nr:MAG: ParE toxin of type II toxin-antitoxin system, parDE [Candidatus Argoarchaeum ethanivorans]